MSLRDDMELLEDAAWVLRVELRAARDRVCTPVVSWLNWQLLRVPFVARRQMRYLDRQR